MLSGKKLTETAGRSVLAAPAIVSRLDAGESILDGITIDYGPADALNRLFLNADTATRAKGIRLSFASMDELVDANRRNLDSWQPLVPIFDPEIGGITDKNGFCIVGRNADGEIIATQAARLYNWTDTDLKQEGESLRMFYADPDKSKREGESCTISAPSATRMVGRAVVPGAVWYRPDYRRKGLHEFIGRVVKGVAFTRWYSDVMFSFMAEHNVAKGFGRKSGYYQTEWDVMLHNSPWGTARLALVWSDAEQIVEYFCSELDALESQVDAVVDGRAANHSS